VKTYCPVARTSLTSYRFTHLRKRWLFEQRVREEPLAIRDRRRRKCLVCLTEASIQVGAVSALQVKRTNDLCQRVWP
jgi:hypothetical protein